MIQTPEKTIQESAKPVRPKLTGLVRMPCPICQCSSAKPETKICGYELEKCTGCGLVYMNPRCTPNHLAEIYTVRDEDRLIDLYADIATPDVIAEYHETLDKLEMLVPEKGRLLDFACAAGYFFEQAQQRGWDAHGCDVGQWAEKAATRRGLPNMHVGELKDLGFPDGHFDVVYAAQVFEHLLNPPQDLSELIRVLKPGGLLYIDVPNYHTLPIMFGKDDFMLNEPPQHINYFTPSTLRHMLVRADMKDIHLSSNGGMKWENLFGRPINSDIASAYGLVENEQPVSDSNSASLMQKCRTSFKNVAKKTVVNPVFYQAFKVGMKLVAVCRKPAV